MDIKLNYENCDFFIYFVPESEQKHICIVNIFTEK